MTVILYSVISFYAILDHMLSSHNIEPANRNKLMICDICGYKTMTKAYLDKHIRYKHIGKCNLYFNLLLG